MTSKAKLTKAYVDSCSTPGFYWDTALTGFGLRISGTTKTYIVQARIAGRDTRRSIGRHGVLTAEEARKKAREALALMADGTDPKAAARARKIEGISLTQVFNDYLTQHPLKPRTQYDYNGFMARAFADWAMKPLTTITADMVEKRHAAIVSRSGGAQADGAMRFLRALFNYAEGKYEKVTGEPLVSSNPTKRLRALKLWARPPRRESYVREEQLARWHQSVMALGNTLASDDADTMRDYLLFVLFTGLRRSESMSLRWEYVDLEGRRFTIPSENTKNKRSHPLPLTTLTLEILQRRWAQRSNDYVFPGRGKTGHLVEPKKAIAKVADDSGIPFTLHDLRRTFATCASTVIDNQSTIKRLMNHLTGGQDVTEGYKQGVERLREPAQRVTNYMLQLIANGLPASTT
ncbi:phage-like integrase [Cupriavidus necator N-1]|uniref:Phage-like integrase n=1 Tax=Cupriavidus necator (strain ATCC 43291 / DSM 13513 / CCUG 52238 / LMG 8453 / N-1) TaxID=1042878 RepID=G0ET33_CUPNN|nr:tyrosine-type recombinase/integrase [Cupriavidus necator]AEI78039.1 phage-like integrase [Cupriavidus necator N-1]MDX6013431.1 tyrosine-type recombinase/integrase [Cupriavidus necator]